MPEIESRIIEDDFIDKKRFIEFFHEENLPYLRSESIFSALKKSHLSSIIILTKSDNGLSISSVGGDFKKMYGYEEKEVLGLNINALEPPEFKGTTHKLLVSGKGNNMVFAVERLNKNGSVSKALARSLRYDINGIERYAVVEVDMHSMKSIADRMEILTTAVNQSANIIVITDPDGNINYVNRSFEEITGYSFEEAMGENPRILKSGVHEKEFYIRMWDTIRSGKIWNGEIVNKKKDGSLYTERMTITPVIKENGDIEAYIAIKEDISKEKELMNAIEKMEKERSKERISRVLLSVFMLLFRLGDEKVINDIILGFGDSFEKKLRPDFDDYLRTKSSGGRVRNRRKAYLMWLNRFFSDIGINNDIDLDKRQLTIHECPWKDMDNKMKPCVICRTIISRSFDWSEEKGRWIQHRSISMGDKECIFDFRFQRRK